MLGLYAIAVVLTLAVGFGFSFRSSVENLDYDEWEYWQLSSDLLRGQFDDPGRRTLGFPIVLAALRLIADEFGFVQIALTFLSSAAVPLLAWFGTRITISRFVGVMAALALACWPPHLFLASSMYSEAVTLPLLLVFLVFLPRRDGDNANRLLIWLLCGCLLGLVAHLRTMYQLFVPFLLVILLLEGWPFRSAVARWLLIVTGFLAVVLPWSTYVSQKTGSAMLLTANGGETLAGGLNPEILRYETEELRKERRSAWIGPGKWLPSSQTGYLAGSENALPYTERDRLLRDRTIAWVLTNPNDAAYLTFRKLAYQWGFYPLSRSTPFQIVAGNIPSMALFLLFTALLAWRFEVRRLDARVWTMPVFTAGIAVISWGSWRFRHPADAMMILAVTVGLLAFVHWRSASQQTVVDR